MSFNIYDIHDDLPEFCYYPICLGFFAFDIDYFSLLPNDVCTRVRQQDLKVLFMYHEGDNPQRIKNRLDTLAKNNNLPDSCYMFVSSNTAADKIDKFVTFHDFELWYYQRNQEHAPLPAHNDPRSKDFTCLSRIHKWWRAVAMADLVRDGLLDNSFWSYCETPDDLSMSDSPIEIDMIPQLRWGLEKFLKNLPHYSDELSQDQRNDHAHLESKYFQDAYCHIVLESQFDVDQSGGAFLTEKTFKPIKHGQMFFIAGGAGSLQALRDLGYRVFDGVIDNSYDLETNHTMRWQRLLTAIQKAKQTGLVQVFDQCRDDIEHNQRLFVSSKQQRLNTLIQKIHEKTQRLHLLATT